MRLAAPVSRGFALALAGLVGMAVGLCCGRCKKSKPEGLLDRICATRGVDARAGLEAARDTPGWIFRGGTARCGAAHDANAKPD